MNKKIVGAATFIGTLALIGAGCSPSGQGTPSATQPTVNYQPSVTVESAASSPDGGAQPVVSITSDNGEVAIATNQDVKEFKMTAKNWEFSPNTITVKKGDRVRLIISSEGEDHGIAIKDFNVDVSLPAGQTKTVEFIADKVGNFTFRCNVPCGPGHREMKGELIVTE